MLLVCVEAGKGTEMKQIEALLDACSEFVLKDQLAGFVRSELAVRDDAKHGLTDESDGWMPGPADTPLNQIDWANLRTVGDLREMVRKLDDVGLAALKATLEARGVKVI